MGESSWILIDYVDVVVHLMLPDVRHFYELEALWGEAKIVPQKFDNQDKAE